jgi:hypothetical protein
MDRLFRFSRPTKGCEPVRERSVADCVLIGRPMLRHMIGEMRSPRVTNGTMCGVP